MWCHVCTAIQEQGMETLIAGIGNKGAVFVENLKTLKLMKSHLFIFRIKVNNDSDKIFLPVGQSPTIPIFEHFCPYEL